MVVGNVSFIPDCLIVQWGTERWKYIRERMREFADLEYNIDLCGYLYYDRASDAPSDK